jgi:hypothetical protein
MFHKVDGESEKCNVSHSFSCGIAKNVLLLFGIEGRVLNNQMR